MIEHRDRKPFRMLIDTCVWLDLAKDYRQKSLLGALEDMVKRGYVSLLLPRTVVDEFARSRVILKSSFFLGFLAAATKEPQFRHPRFVMIDTIEDKGMEPERSHNFQNQILRVSREATSDHQIIYATAMIAPDLDDEAFLIGRFSTRDAPTLAIDT